MKFIKAEGFRAHEFIVPRSIYFQCFRVADENIKFILLF